MLADDGKRDEKDKPEYKRSHADAAPSKEAADWK